MHPTQIQFAERLDTARIQHHLSIRAVARLAGVPTATAQGWLNGRHLPTPALRAQYLTLVEALELSDELPDDLFLSGTEALRDKSAPYLGLRPYDVTDRDRYFGRQGETERVAGAVVALQSGDGCGFLALVGPSGSGKSSLLAAGLVGQETRPGSLLAGWRTTLIHPRELVASGASWADRASPTDAPELVLVDQLEDLFAMQEVDRQDALRSLAGWAETAVVLIALRSDSFAAASQEPVLRSALSRPLLLSPLTASELREVITGPSMQVSVKVDDDLVSVLAREVSHGSPHGLVAFDALPLLSNALLLTWACGQGKRMTVNDYLRTGGIQSAVENLAEEVFHGLTEEQQALVRGLFLRLVSLDQDVLVRAPLPLASLGPASGTVVDRFVEARMLTLAADTVRISHDALLRHWSRLTEWIDQGRQDVEALQHLRRAARVWEENGRDPASLVPVRRLPALRDWLGAIDRTSELTPLENDFVSASEIHFDDLLTKERRTTANLRRRGRIAVALTAAVSALAIVAGGLFWQGRGFQLATQSRQVALESALLRSQDSNLQAQMALVSSRLSDTREGKSSVLDSWGSDVPTRWLGPGSAVLARSDDEQLVARADGKGSVTLWRAGDLASTPGTSFQVDPDQGALYAVTLGSVQGRTLLAVGGANVRTVWDVTVGPVKLADLIGEDATTTFAMDFDNRGRLALGTAAGAVSVWSFEKPEAPKLLHQLSLGRDIQVSSVAFNQDGSQLLAAGAVNRIARWAIGKTSAKLADLTFSYEDGVRAQTLAWSPDGTQIAAGLSGLRVERWSLNSSDPKPESPLENFNSWVNDVSFSSDGKHLIVGSSDQWTSMYDAVTGSEQRRVQGPSLVTGVELVGGRPVSTSTDGALRAWSAVSPVLRAQGTTLYALSSDRAERFLAASTRKDGIQLWSGAEPMRKLPSPDAGSLRVGSAVAVAPNGRFLVSGTIADGILVSWPLGAEGAGQPSRLKAFPTGYVGAVAVAPDSTLVGAIHYGGDAVGLFATDPDGRLEPLARLISPVAQSLAFSNDSKLLAIPLGAGEVQLWSLTDPRLPVLIGTIKGFDSTTLAAAFGPGGNVLAVGTDAGYVSVWDLADPGRPVRTHEYRDPHAAVYAVTFSPDGQTLLAGGGDTLVWGWHLDDPREPAFAALDPKVGRTNDVRFLRAGTVIAVAGDSGRLQLLPADPEAAHEELCRSRGSALTPQEWLRYLPGVEPFAPC